MPLPSLHRSAAAISPTAHYTGYVWARNGLGAPELETLEGRIAFWASAPAMAVSAALGGPALEGMLLARHRVMDHLLTEAIVGGRVGQVIELAAGMSPRGLSFSARFPELTYVETDLPGMVARKRRALGRLGPGHAIEELDASRADGPGSLPALAATLDRSRGLAVISEGLLNYLPPAAVTELWHRIATATGAFPHGLYLADLHVGSQSGPLEKGFMAALGVAVRGRVHVHFPTARAAAAAGREAGFASVELHRPPDLADRVPGVRGAGSDRVRVVEARTIS